MKKIFLIMFLILATCFMTSCKKKTKTFTVTFMDGEVLLKTEQVEEGKNAVGLTPTKEGYTFTGWSESIENITADVTVYAQFNINTYTVTFKDGDEVLKTETVEYGKDAVGLRPTKEGYTFTGWSASISNVTSDITVTANYVINSHTVTFMDGESVLKTENINYGDDLSLVELNKEGYILEGIFADELFSETYDINAPVVSDLVLYVKFINKNVWKWQRKKNPQNRTNY